MLRCCAETADVEQAFAMVRDCQRRGFDFDEQMYFHFMAEAG